MEVRGAGFTKFAIGCLWEVLRWYFQVRKTEEFKCCDQYRSRYARWLMWRYPALKGFFDEKPLRTV
jgi:hypothetical protein